MLDSVRRWLRRSEPTPCPAPAFAPVPEPRGRIAVLPVKPTPVRRRRPVEELHRLAVLAEGNAAPGASRALTPKEHAHRLVAWCQQMELGDTGEILAAELMEAHLEMCAAEGLAVRPWNPVACELTRLTTGSKDYRWVECDDGLHRLRVYYIPPAGMTAEVFRRRRQVAQMRKADRMRRAA